MIYPPVTIVATTYFQEGELGLYRRDVAKITINTWVLYLYYEGGSLHLHLADDGSYWNFHDAADTRDWQRVSSSKQHRRGVGASLNAGFMQAFQEESPLVAYFVDDWSLIQPFNLLPWAKLLLEREDIGMVRLGPPHPNTRGTVEAFTDDWQSWGLRLDRYAFAFGHRPALYHKRFIDHYGWFDEDLNALECERLYAERFCADPNGPDIVLALPHPWQHLDTISMSSVDPHA